MLNLITNNVCIYKYKCIKIVNINTKTNNHTRMILTITEHIQCIGTVCTLIVMSSSSGEFHCLVHALTTKCPCDEMAGDEVSP